MTRTVGRRPPTIQDVARRAGVSVATVSRVINNSELVRMTTRERVEAAIAELDYSPSWLARDLRQDKTSRVLVLFPSLHSPVMADVFRGIDDVARAKGYFSLICPTAKDRERERELVRMLTNRSVDGLIFFGTTLDAGELQALGRRHSIVQCSEWKDAPSTGRVSIDDFRAASDITEHLLGLGHRRVAMIANRSESSGVLRESGFRAALSRAGMVPDESFILDGGDYEYDTGRRLLRDFAAREETPTALLCISDTVAAGVLTEAREIGIAVPADLAVAGFDDSPEARMTVPQLTTVRQPFYEIGRHGMEQVLHKIAYPLDRPNEPIVLPHEVVVRESTRSR